MYSKRSFSKHVFHNLHESFQNKFYRISYLSFSSSSQKKYSGEQRCNVDGVLTAMIAALIAIMTATKM